jgi:molybdate/tungstate transport system substrate-binding protein
LKRFAVVALIAAVAAISFLPGVSRAANAVVSVLYAGSLVTPMEGPIKSALASQGIDFQGQGGGSTMLSNLIASGAKNPDVFISVDPAQVAKLGAKVAVQKTFAGTSLGIGWTAGSKDAALFDSVAAGKTPLLRALQTNGLVIARTDPKIDPKGEYTIVAMKMLAGDAGEQKILGDDENPAQTFPEEDLLARLETGQADVGFFYRTEAIARNLKFYALPGKASLSDKITYTIAVMANAPEPAQAKAFADFILTGQGRTILEKAGLTYRQASQ